MGGDAFTVDWTVQNQGTSPTEDAVLFDQVYLSDKPTFVPPSSGQTSATSGTSARSSTTASSPPNGSYTRQAHVPALARDLRPVRHRGDQHGRNRDQPRARSAPGHGRHLLRPPGKAPTPTTTSASAPRMVTPLPPADLQVTSIVDPGAELLRRSDDRHLDGHRTSARRPGPAPATGPTRSTSPATRRSTSTATRCVGEFAHSNDQPLAAGASYTQSASFTCPRASAGPRPIRRPSTSTSSPIRTAALTAHARDNDASRGSSRRDGYEDATNNQGDGTPAGHLPRAGPAGHEPGRPGHGAALRRHHPDHLDRHQPRQPRHPRRATGPTAFTCRATRRSTPATPAGRGHAQRRSCKTGDHYTTTLNVRLPDGIGGDYLHPGLHRLDRERDDSAFPAS